MAFATKYKTTINNWPGDTITAEIQADGFAGTAEEFTPIGGNAVVITHEADINNKHAYIIQSRATVQMYVNDEWDMHDLLYATDREFKVVIKNGSNEEFIGWLVSGVNTEEYTTGHYVVKIEATDGLADLKDIPYLNSGALYDAFQTPLTIIQNCLAKTGFSFSLWENTDIYAASGMTTTTNTSSPLNQSYIHTAAYGDRIEDVLSSWDVLSKVLQAVHCRLFQRLELSGTTAGWVMSKINKLNSTTTYRKYTSGGTYSTYASHAPLLTMGVDIEHVNGAGRISSKQAYKEVNLIAERGQEYQLIDGQNFEDADFPTASTLTNWSSLSTMDLTGTWGGAVIAKETKDGETVANLNSYATTPTAATFTQSGANVSVAKPLHGLTTSDWIIIPDGEYIGIWKVVTVTDANNFLINASYTQDETSGYAPITGGVGIETNVSFPLDNDIALLDLSTDRLRLDLEYYYEPNGTHDTDSPFKAIAIIVCAYVGATDYKVIDHNGVWRDRGTTLVKPIIIPIDTTNINKVTYSLEASMASDNNFYTSGTPDFYVAILTGQRQAFYSSDYMFRSIKLSMIGGATKTHTTSINSDYVESLALDMFHADGDGNDNDEWRYLHPIYDDATPKRFINSWQQDGGTADNLEDIIEANLAASYNENSQIWEGSLEGDLTIADAVKDPLNLAREFQLQRISRNLVTNINQVGMIEVVPAKAYYIERMSSSAGVDKYYLSAAYGDVSSLFLAGGTVQISDIRRKSDSVIVEIGNDMRTLAANATYDGTRTQFEVSDMAYSIDPGTGLEVKGVLRIL